MKIERIELRRITLPLASRFKTSTSIQYERSCLIVMVHAQGIAGYAECVAGMGPWYTYETIDTAWLMLRDVLAPRLLEADVQNPATIGGVFAPVRGHPMAKAALEMACWDLIARLNSLPLARLLGGAYERVPVGVSIGLHDSPAELVETVERYLAEGYRRIKLKIAPGQDQAFIAAVRHAEPTAHLQVDANSSYTLDDLSLLKSFDQYNLLLIEQPLDDDDIVDHATLQRELDTPVCLDESIQTLNDARQALNLGSCRVINIKPGRVGGHQQSRAIHDLCLRQGIAVWCGGMLETNIGRAHNIALASLAGFTLPGDISASARYYEHDIAGPDFLLNDDSTITVPASPGCGVEPDWPALESATEHFLALP